MDVMGGWGRALNRRKSRGRGVRTYNDVHEKQIKLNQDAKLARFSPWLRISKRLMYGDQIPGSPVTLVVFQSFFLH